ncbi:MAG: hypothetical protein WCT33_03740 [Patescibacteria group bacterium]
MKKISIIAFAIITGLFVSLYGTGTNAAISDYEGRILLDVERHGEAYYIYQGSKYYLGRPAQAFEIMKNLSLGISEENFLSGFKQVNDIWQIYRIIDSRLFPHIQGRIVIRPDANGEAYYVTPGLAAGNGYQAEYLDRPADAFRIMTKYGLGARSVFIDSIPTGVINSSPCVPGVDPNCTSSGEPSISSVSDTSISNGQSITISGNDFGTKGSVAPLRWDNFDNGTLGARLPSQANGGWTTGANQAGKEPRYSNTHVRLPGTLSAYQNFTGGNYNSEISLQGVFDGNVYLSGWFYRTSSGAPSRNYKWIQLRQGDLDEASWEFRHDVYPSTNSGHMYVANSCPNGVPCSLCDDEVGIPGYTPANCNMYYGMNGDLKTGSWHRYEVWLTQGTLGQNNGHARIWLDGQPWMTMNGVFDPSGCRFHNMWLGFYFATDTGSPQPQMETWWDELYVDVNPTRVEVCSGATWEDRGKCEIQVPQNVWDSNSIQIKINQGTFADGADAYLFVVDANGNASNGYPISF